MKVFNYIFGVLFLLQSCSSKDKETTCKEFTHYPNNSLVNKNGSIFNYYFIENAPDNDKELLEYTKNIIDKRMKFKLNDSIKSVVFLFFISRSKFLFDAGVDENYISKSSTVEDYNNPRRVEYTFQLQKDNKILLTTSVYKRGKSIIPKITHINSKILNNEKSEI